MQVALVSVLAIAYINTVLCLIARQGTKTDNSSFFSQIIAMPVFRETTETTIGNHILITS
jgi:hypothetical protein